MRICSLLPSITEILFEIGLGDQVVGVTHECDWPPQARNRPHLTRSRIHESKCASAEIDHLVQEQAGSLYELDAKLLATLRPDLILTQSLCPVCAVDEIVVRRTAETLPTKPCVLSFHPTCLADVYRKIETIGDHAVARGSADQLLERFRTEITRVQRSVHECGERPSVVLLEWTDPPFVCGHWTPELVELAGGRELLGRAGEPSRRATWAEINAADPNMLVIAPCGFTLERALQDVAVQECRDEWTALQAVRTGSVFVTDGSAYFNRPGPRLIDSLRILAEVLHPETFAGRAPPGSFQQVMG